MCHNPTVAARADAPGPARTTIETTATKDRRDRTLMPTPLPVAAAVGGSRSWDRTSGGRLGATPLSAAVASRASTAITHTPMIVTPPASWMTMPSATPLSTAAGRRHRLLCIPLDAHKPREGIPRGRTSSDSVLGRAAEGELQVPIRQTYAFDELPAGSRVGRLSLFEREDGDLWALRGRLSALDRMMVQEDPTDPAQAFLQGRGRDSSIWLPPRGRQPGDSPSGRVRASSRRSVPAWA